MQPCGNAVRELMRKPGSSLDLCSCATGVEPSHHHPGKTSSVNNIADGSLHSQNVALQHVEQSAVLDCDAVASSSHWQLQGDVHIQVKHILESLLTRVLDALLQSLARHCQCSK